MSGPRPGTLGVFALGFINIAAVLSIRNAPFMAEYGWSMLVLFAVAILAFLVPISLAAAELGTGWPADGGIYAWVREAFGRRTGFFAVWCDYSENIAWFPTVLSFMAASLAYVFDPELATNRWFLFSVMMVFFWGTTLVNLRGVTTSSWIGSVGTIIGSIVPAVLLAVLGVAWLARGEDSAIPFSAGALVPDVHVTNLAFMGSIILLFTGMEMAGYHAREMRNPGRDLPRAIFLAVVIIVVFSVMGSLALALIVPTAQLSLVSGTMEALEKAFDTFGVSWLVRPVALVVAVGGIAHLTPWVLGPAKGVAAVGRDGTAPARLGRTNRADVPVLLVIAQAIGGTVFALAFVFVNSANTAYTVLSAITAQIIILMYVLMLVSLLRLRYTQPDTVRAFRIPGGRVGAWLVCGLGVAALSFAFYLGFIPPDQLKIVDTWAYVAGVAGGLVLLSAPPFVFALARRGRPVPGSAPPGSGRIGGSRRA